MSRLGELQRLFTQALLHNDDAVVSTIHGGGLEPAARMARIGKIKPLFSRTTVRRSAHGPITTDRSQRERLPQS